jgi:hypothetical protein
MQEARRAAEIDAEAFTNSGLWFLAGCLGTAVGVIIAYVYTPSPPASRLIGKSPEYVAYYTDFYKTKAKSIQTSKAWTGCLVNVGIQVASTIYFIVVIAAD